MAKGLKQMVADAQKGAQPKPVDISGEALHTLSVMMRRWSGWRDSTVIAGVPTVSEFADCDHNTHTFTANVDKLLLNPHRVLHTVTPFRLRQEAVLTGALMHEAGHARFSHWLPRNKEQFDTGVGTLSDGTRPSNAVLSLARTMEEPRVEGLMAENADKFGATGLDWTMRASAAALIPTTMMSMVPAQALMDFITSWALRAGRQFAIAFRTERPARQWAHTFTSSLTMVLVEHMRGFSHTDEDDLYDPSVEAGRAVKILLDMLHCDDHTGPTMLDSAKAFMDMVFPETESDEQPESGGGCAMPMPEEGESDESDEGDEDSAESGSGGDQSEDSDEEDTDEGESEGAGGDESDEEDDTEGEGQSDADKPGDGDEDSEDDGSGDGDTDEEDTDEGDSEDSDADDDVSDESDTGEADTESDTESEMAKALAELEAEAEDDGEDEAKAETSGNGAGVGHGDGMGGGWRLPKKEEFEVQKNAERFLRDLISPSEQASVVLSETPSATVDPAAMAAWKAGGMVRDPMFFRRTRREVQPSPPVKIAVLVDISSSMGSLQAPSALLSWALAAAAVDLRNFAGRGQQVESTLIHWGSDVHVIQKNGALLPGIREVPCNEGTTVMHQAIEEAGRQIPGFLDPPDKPENRLLVQFTDWQLLGYRPAEEAITKALAAGVNMLSVVPQNYSPTYGSLDTIIRNISRKGLQRGTSSVLRYNPMFPEQVWDEAAKILA